MTSISLFKDVRNEVESLERSFKNMPETPIIMPPSLPTAIEQIRYAQSASEAEAIYNDIAGMNVINIACDTEFSMQQIKLPGKQKPWFDISSVRPLLATFAVLALMRNGQRFIMRVAFDLRCSSVMPWVDKILRLRAPLIFHNVKAELFVFWKLGLEANIHNFYCTYMAASCIHLGAVHKRATYNTQETVALTDQDELEMDKQSDEKREKILSLQGQCAYYKIPHSFASQKASFQNYFGNFTEGSTEPFSKESIEYAVADALFTLKVHAAQQKDIYERGLFAHLYQVEFPFAMVNARMEWRGLPVDKKQMKAVSIASKQAAEFHERSLSKINDGPLNPASYPQKMRLLEKLDLTKLISAKTDKGSVSLSSKALAPLKSVHPAFDHILQYAKYSSIANAAWLTGKTLGVDGRLHSQHRQLGAQTGRNSCKDPNIAGLPKILRPVVVAPPGRAIVDPDYCQIEVGVMAAEFGDDKLIAAFNQGDVFGAMAIEFYQDQLTQEERRYDLKTFKERKSSLRGKIKTFVYALIYGASIMRLAKGLGVNEAQAQQMCEKFFCLYPALQAAREQAIRAGVWRGYAYTVSGLRRFIPPGSKITNWTRNFLGNTPIQGSATVVFKHAANEIDRHFYGTDTWIILTVHDSIVLECNLNNYLEVVSVVKEIMSQSLQYFYPQLHGEIGVNIEYPGCWCHEGDYKSIEKFLENPGMTMEFTESTFVHDADL